MDSEAGNAEMAGSCSRRSARVQRRSSPLFRSAVFRACLLATTTTIWRARVTAGTPHKNTNPAQPHAVTCLSVVLHALSSASEHDRHTLSSASEYDRTRDGRPALALARRLANKITKLIFTGPSPLLTDSDSACSRVWRSKSCP